MKGALRIPHRIFKETVKLSEKLPPGETLEPVGPSPEERHRTALEVVRERYRARKDPGGGN